MKIWSWLLVGMTALGMMICTPVIAQQVVDVYFEDLGFDSATSYVFQINSATGAPIGIRTSWFPQGPGVPSSYSWSSNGNILTLNFLTTTDVLELTGYDATNDLLNFSSRPPYYWAGCNSPYIPAGIPGGVAQELCALVTSSQIGMDLEK